MIQDFWKIYNTLICALKLSTTVGSFFCAFTFLNFFAVLTHTRVEVIKMEKKKWRKDDMGGVVPYIRSYHAVPFNNMNEIFPIFSGVDNDLGVENMESDMDFTAADKEDFRKKQH